LRGKSLSKEWKGRRCIGAKSQQQKLAIERWQAVAAFHCKNAPLERQKNIARPSRCMESEPDHPLTLGDAAKTSASLIVWCRGPDCPAVAKIRLIQNT
jgi:hypothetical protein